MAGLRCSPPKFLVRWPPLALPLLLANAAPGAGQPLEPEGRPPPAGVPLIRLEPGWGSLQQTLGLPA